MPSTVLPNGFRLRRAARLVLLTAVIVAVASTPVAGQDMEATFEDDSVAVDDEMVNTTLSVTGYTGPLIVRSRNVSNETLVRMFDGRATEDGVRVDVPADGTLTAKFPPSFRCSPGQYVFTVADGDRTANASIAVAAPPVAAAAFESQSVTVSAHDTVRVGVRIDRCHDGNVTLRVGGPDSSVHAGVRFGSNASGSGNGTIRFNASDLTGPGSFAVEPDLDRRHVTVERAPPDGRLPAGGYDLHLYANGEQVDLATLQVEPENTTQTGTRESGDGETATGTESVGDRPSLDMPGFGFLAGTVAVLAAVVLLTRNN